MSPVPSNSAGPIISNNNAIPIIVDYNISQITPYLFVTAEDSARQFQKIFSNGIACVINVANELPYIAFPPQSGIESIKYPIVDNPLFPVSQYFDTVADRIAANVASNRRTLLYCHHGRSRSITFILAYLIKHHHLPLLTAFTLVKQNRQVASPNVGFWSQLISYELDQRRREQYTGTVVQQSLTYYSQQMLYKIFGGLDNIFGLIPVVTAFKKTMQPIK